MSRSSLNDLFHRTAEEAAPLAQRLLALTAQQLVVQADETTVRVLVEGKTRTAWLWTFRARAEGKDLIAYCCGFRSFVNAKIHSIVNSRIGPS